MLLGCCVEPEQIPLLRAAGFDYAELRVEFTRPLERENAWRVWRDQLLSWDVPILAFNVMLPAGCSVVGPDASITKLGRYLQVAFERMAELGGKHVAFGSGGARRVPEQFDREEACGQLLSFLSLLADLGDSYGIQVNLEFLNRKETNFINSLLDARDIARALNRQSVRLLADFYHLMEEQEPLSDLKEAASDIGYVHVADTGRRHPGSGTYPYSEFFALLKGIHYDGPVSVECSWRDFANECHAAASFLRSFMTDASDAPSLD